MDSHIFTFEKTKQERLDDYMGILCSRMQPLRASEVFDEWRFYLELVLEPICWQAFWKISRVECERLSIRFPTVVFVEVVNVDFNLLYATIKTLAVQDNIEIPTVNKVPLQHLFPTKQQDNDVLDTEGTASCIDQFRFFYNNLWYPWDVDSDNENWTTAHLEPRLQLYYDMQSGIVSPETVVHIQTLLKEGKDINVQISHLQNESDLSESDNEDKNNILASRLTELELRKHHIKVEIEMLENPVIRNIIIKKQQLKAKEKRDHTNGHSKEVHFIWLGGQMDDLVRSIADITKSVHPTTFVRCLSNVQDALDQSHPEDTITLCAGTHCMNGILKLEKGGLLKGLAAPYTTILTSFNSQNVFLDCLPGGDVLKLENLSIDALSVQTTILVRSGVLRLSNCRVVGNGESSTQQGILVLGGAMLVADNCEFIDLGCAVVVDSGGEVSLTNCRVTRCFDGFQVADQSKLDLEKCSITGCKGSGIIIETVNQVAMEKKANKIGSITILEGLDRIKVKDSVVENNSKGDVVLITKDPNIAVLYSED